jgi:hypothetical protein
VHEPLDRIGLVHDADPRAEARVNEPVAESADEIADDEDRVGRVHSQGDVGDEVTERRDQGDAAAAEGMMEAGVGEGRDGVAGERREENERDDGVADVVVFLELGKSVAFSVSRSAEQSIPMG